MIQTKYLMKLLESKWAKPIFFMEFSLSQQQVYDLVGKIITNGKFLFVKNKEIVDKDNIPIKVEALCFYKVPFYLSSQEVFLNAGDTASTLSAKAWVPRPLTNVFENLLKYNKSQNDNSVDVRYLESFAHTNITNIPASECPDPLLPGEKYKHIVGDIKKYIAENKKIGLILHGPPGNGKSYFIRWLAKELNVPISIPVMDNYIHDTQFTKMFVRVKKPSIILMEDFDSIFDGRKAVLEDQELRFSAVLNVLDGLVAPSGSLIFIITTNHINKIDPALKDRPSRFKYIIKFDNPNIDIRGKIFKDLPIEYFTKAVKETNNLSLDQVLDYKQKQLWRKS